MSLSVPGPISRLPGVGPALAVLRFARDPLERMEELFTRYGDIVSLDRRGGTRIFSSRETCRGTIFGRGPEFLRVVELDGTSFHRSATTGRIFPRGEADSRRDKLRECGTGLFAVNGAEHARHRKSLSPAFSNRNVEEWIPAFSEIALRTADSWQESQEIDLYDELKDITLRCATLSLFGRELGLTSPIAVAAEETLRALISPSVLFAQWDLPGFPYRGLLDNVGKFSEEAHNIVAQRRSEGARGNDLLSILIRQTGLSDREVVGHAGVLLAAGHETTAFAITIALFLLAQHPEVASHVAEEVHGTLRGGIPSPDDLRSMPLLERVINESLRLLPPAPWTARETSRRTSVLGYELETGTELVLAIFHTQRMPEIWQEPTCFRPDRWESTTPNPYEFNPFGGGARTCIGRNFAMMEMRLLLSLLLNRFRFELSPTPVDLSVSITMSLTSGLGVRVRKADGNWKRERSPASGNIHRYVTLPT